MLIPIGHENMSARRWPVVTLALIVVNVVVFLFTHFGMEAQNEAFQRVRLHVALMAAMHPELTVPPAAQPFVDDLREHHQRTWKQLTNLNRPVIDEFDAHLRMSDTDQHLQDEMDVLGTQYMQLEASSLEPYEFVPSHPTPLTYVTANFLHGGWLHLIGNMWFLWLAGFVLEDNWGRILYTIFYFAAGAAALYIHALINPGSMVPTIGASGAIAGLMGAFLVRFPKMKIRMRWFFGIRSLLRGGYEFSAAAYWLLPLWLLTELFFGSLVGQGDGVAHWAHVGGFGFGAVIGLLLRVTGLEHKANQAVEQKTTWTSAPEIMQASDLLEQGQNGQAADLLGQFVAANPESVDAYNLLQQALWRKGDVPGFQQVMMRLCALHLKLREPELAWQCFDEFMNSGGKSLPVGAWFDLCRYAEQQGWWERAASEYEKLAACYPTERQALNAQMGAARICLKQLNRPAEALKFYQAAAASPIPHLDWEQTIEAGIREAKKALSPVPA